MKLREAKLMNGVLDEILSDESEASTCVQYRPTLMSLRRVI
jgi:hypothetical protein